MSYLCEINVWFAGNKPFHSHRSVHLDKSSFMTRCVLICVLVWYGCQSVPCYVDSIESEFWIVRPWQLNGIASIHGKFVDGNCAKMLTLGVQINPCFDDRLRTARALLKNLKRCNDKQEKSQFKLCVLSTRKAHFFYIYDLIRWVQ